jgi:7-cyano-7-deazaguanine synthase
MSQSKIVVPISGGMDSTVLLYKACEEVGPNNVFALAFNYGQRHLRELELAAHHACEKKCNSFKLIDAQFIKDIAPTSSLTNNEIDTPDIREIAGEAQPKSYVPNRNMIFLSVAAAYAEAVGAHKVYHGATGVDSLAGYWDASPEFLPTMNEVLSLNRETRITIEAPLINMDKASIVREGVRLEVKFSKTYTCYSGEDKADANSASSALRIKGFANAGYIDPQPYKQDLTQIWEKYKCRKIPYDYYNS